MGVSNATGQVLAAVVGGIAGSLILVLAYFIGIALIGAGLGALVAHVSWGYVRPGDPPVALLIALAIFGAIGAMLLQRYVIIVATAFGGAWTIIICTLAMTAARTPATANARNAEVWILYPMSPVPDQKWIPLAWVVLGLIGTAVQLGLTAKKRT